MTVWNTVLDQDRDENTTPLSAFPTKVDCSYDFHCPGETKETPAIIVYGTSWCPDVLFARRYLDRHGVEYEYFDIDDNKEAMNALFEISGVDWLVPTVVFPDGSIISNPSIKALAEKLGRPKRKDRGK